MAPSWKVQSETYSFFTGYFDRTLNKDLGVRLAWPKAFSSFRATILKSELSAITNSEKRSIITAYYRSLGQVSNDHNLFPTNTNCKIENLSINSSLWRHLWRSKAPTQKGPSHLDCPGGYLPEFTAFKWSITLSLSLSLSLYQLPDGIIQVQANPW